MASGVFTALSKGLFALKRKTIESEFVGKLLLFYFAGDPLPLASLRLLVPPLQLMTTSMWQVLKTQDIMNYWKVAEFVSLVMDMVPELLMYKHRMQLNLGLRARVGTSGGHKAFMEVAVNFLELIQTLLKDPEERREFFLEVFPAEYGPQYDSDLQTLFSEFLFRLAQLLPVPDLEQTVSWLGAERSVLEECVHSVSEPTDLKILLQVAKPTEQPNQSDPLPGLSEDTHTVSFVDDVAVEIITVTDYAEVELGTSTDIEVVMGETCCEGPDTSIGAEDSLVVLPDAITREEEKVQQHIDKVHSVEAEDDKLSLQPLADEEGRFSCADCEKSFKFQSLLKAHQRIHTGEQPFLCSQCGRRFSFKQSLERHKQTHKSGRKYECLICGEFFKSLVAQREHKSTHMENGEYLCSECGRRSYKCPRCDLGFSCASYLNRHLQTHQEERVHSCNCGKSFAYRAALTAHQRIHQKERPHICPQCGKGFLYKGGLLSHMKIHSEEMPFMCAFCGKSFKRERNMKKHERCHTRENVFSCSQCDKSFVYKATLTRHELTHSGERPYLCSDCGKGFFSHAELLKHERFHTGHKPFQCPHCGKKFTQSCYLTIHLRYHTGVRPYSCDNCDKSFLSANRLKRHQRTHSGEKPYLCGECGKGFRQSYNLKMHQRTHIIKLRLEPTN
uniref:C2H2-type domain-containing protein n=1 Tax=Dicentrarchus labrax TaxID=13489 RepID=A0A8P4KFP8_DICLA